MAAMPSWEELRDIRMAKAPQTRSELAYRSVMFGVSMGGFMGGVVGAVEPSLNTMYAAWDSKMKTQPASQLPMNTVKTAFSRALSGAVFYGSYHALIQAMDLMEVSPASSVTSSLVAGVVAISPFYKQRAALPMMVCLVGMDAWERSSRDSV